MTTSQYAEVLSGYVDARPVPPLAGGAKLPASDFDEPSGDTLGEAEGQSFAIEYVDSRGQSSRRRITVWAINAGKDGIPCLVAKCHERNATRTFRIDRIKCCIDFTGEVFDDVPAFLSDTFGMSEVRAASREEPETARWRNILNIVRADAVLLAAMSRSDGSVRPVETDAAVDHLSYIIEHEGEFLSGKDVGRIWHHVHSLRPGLQAIDRALGDLSSRSPDRIKRLIMAAVAVMDADGQRHQAEARMLNELARELLGITLF